MRNNIYYQYFVLSIASALVFYFSSIKPSMEIGHILMSQIILFSSIVGTITASECSGCAESLKYIVGLSFIRVSGEKGAILLLFSISIFVLFLIDSISSQARTYKVKHLYKRTKKAKHYHLQNTFVAFLGFVSAYIFQSLSFRVYNLIGISLLLLNIKSLVIILNVRFLKTWIYSSFIVCNVLVFCFTFLKNFESFYSLASCALKFKYLNK